MRKTGFFTVLLIAGLSMTGIAHAAKGGRPEPVDPRERGPEKTEKDHRDEDRLKQQQSQSGNRISDASIKLARFAGLTQSLKLQTAMDSRPYIVEVVDKNSSTPSSKFLTINVSEQASKLAHNIEALSQSGNNAQKLALAKETAKFLLLASDKYAPKQGEGKEDLTLAQSAWARQLETAVSLTAPDATVKPEVLSSHIEFLTKANEIAANNESSRTEASVMLAAIQATRAGTLKRALTDQETKEELDDIKNCSN